MELFKKTYWLITPFLILVFILLLDKVFNVKEILINTAIAVGLAYILSSKVKNVEKQIGKEAQIK